jgi:hypothetical protein
MVQIAVEIPEDLHARLAERCERLNLKKSDEVRLALRRHLDHPPADASPPLPDAVPTGTSKTTVKAKRNKG